MIVLGYFGRGLEVRKVEEEAQEKEVDREVSRECGR
jgi:hypothetical protein